MLPSTHVRKIRSPHTTGEECPGGSSVLHKALLGEKETGGRAEADTPCPAGPRNWGQKGCAFPARGSIQQKRPATQTRKSDARREEKEGLILEQRFYCSR